MLLARIGARASKPATRRSHGIRSPYRSAAIANFDLARRRPAGSPPVRSGAARRAAGQRPARARRCRSASRRPGCRPAPGGCSTTHQPTAIRRDTRRTESGTRARPTGPRGRRAADPRRRAVCAHRDLPPEACAPAPVDQHAEGRRIGAQDEARVAADDAVERVERSQHRVELRIAAIGLLVDVRRLRCAISRRCRRRRPSLWRPARGHRGRHRTRSAPPRAGLRPSVRRRPSRARPASARSSRSASRQAASAVRCRPAGR